MTRSTIFGGLAILATLAALYVFVPQTGLNRDLSMAGVAFNQVHMYELFTTWKAQHGKTYGSVTENAMRFGVFSQNYKKIVDFNAEGHTSTVGLNQFADLTGEEFAATIGCLNEQMLESKKQFPTVDFYGDLPTSVDWRTKGAVTGVKNQGQCGGCWAFAAASSMESYNFLMGNTLTDFSPQQLIDCVTDCSGCDGCDNLYNALIYTSTNGIETLTDYPFTGETGVCRYDSSKTVIKNQGYYNVQAKNETALKAAIAQQPLEVGIQANQLVFQFYSGGVISKLCGDKVDHAVTAVGYGSESGQDAYIIKNSWGETWGVQGYVYISTDDTQNGGNGVCGILTFPAYPTTVPGGSN